MARARRRTPLTVSRPALLAHGSDAEFRGLIHDLIAYGHKLDACRDAFAAIAGISGVQYEILMLASRADGLSVGEVAARLPEAANTTRDAIGEANRAFQEANRIVRAGSDEQLKVVGAASLGFAAGLLIGGANRLLVIAALVPSALIGTEWMQRRSTTP